MPQPVESGIDERPSTRRLGYNAKRSAIQWPGTATAAGGGFYQASASGYPNFRLSVAAVDFPERIAQLSRVTVAPLIAIDAVEQQSEDSLPIQNLENGLDIGPPRRVRANDHHHTIAEVAHGLRVR